MKLEEIVDIVCKDRKQLCELLVAGQHLSLYDYYQKTHTTDSIESPLKQSIIEIIIKLAKKRGIVVEDDILKKELKDNFRVGTADHHGPLTHSFFSNNALMETVLAEDNNKKYIVNLPCAGITLDNSSFPRGFLFHENNKIKKIPLISSARKNEPVYGAKINIDNITSYIEKNKFLKEQSKLKEIIINLFTKDDLNSYEELITYINFKLWQELKVSPKLITVDQESIVNEILIEHIGKHHGIDAILFNVGIREKYLEIFDCCVGAHNYKKKSGTQLFWYRGEKKREQMFIENDNLVTSSGIKIKLEKETVRDMLKEKKIYPCMSLTFIILCGFGGLRTDGGFCQINYLVDIMDRLKKLAENNDVLGTIYSPNPSIFRGEFVLENKYSKTPIDFILENNPLFLNKIRDDSKNISLENAIYGMMDEFYKITTGTYPIKK